MNLGAKTGLLGRLARVFLIALWFLVLPILALILIEGTSSLVLFVLKIRSEPVRVYMAPDSLLGWVSQPNVNIPDLYGPGVYLRTNAQRFRGNHAVAARVASGRVRMICSGDSFTLGSGVDNDHTWCERLTAQHRGIETVNMAQGGYGIDQAYLWYKRDGVTLEHQVHLFGFIANDFARMKGGTFNGYGKPVLAIRDGALTTENVPVPSSPFYARWLSRSAEAIAQLRASKLIRLVVGHYRPAQATDQTTADSLTWEVAAKVFADLDSVNRAKRSVLVLVFLPTQDDQDNGSREWRRRVHEFSEREHIALVDLVADFERLPADSTGRLFLREGDAAGHYTTAGNEWVANQLYQHLLTIPEVARRLSQLP
jgi:hypothetical protein